MTDPTASAAPAPVTAKPRRGPGVVSEWPGLRPVGRVVVACFALAKSAHADPALHADSEWMQFIRAAVAPEVLAFAPTGSAWRECRALGVRAPLYAGLVREDDPDQRVIGLDLLLGEQRVAHVAADAQEGYNLGSAEPLDANGDGVGDLILHFADRYGSVRDAYGAVLLGCGDGVYLYSGTLRLGADGGEARVEPVAGGLMVERVTRPPPEDPTASVRVLAGYRLLRTTFRIEPLLESPDRDVVSTALKRASETP